MSNFSDKTCIVIGASHAGVNFVFSLRKQGWEGRIILIDKDPTLPYHRPPLSKGYLMNDDAIDENLLKSEQSYDTNDITLKLGVSVGAIDRIGKKVTLDNGQELKYDTLVLATGARPIIPRIKGIESAKRVFPLRTAQDVSNIREVFKSSAQKRVVVIGGGYIGLETAASLKKLGASSVTILEREQRVLARVTAPEMSHFFKELHASNNVNVVTNKNVAAIEEHENTSVIICEDSSKYEADIVVVGVGIYVNKELAENAGLTIENGIKVDQTTKTNDPNIYAIGDCTYHHNLHYDCFVRLESVQNAVDQAKVAASTICGAVKIYDTIPWFWSDQYDVKLQMVGLSKGYTHTVLRKEEEDNKFSLWYFKNQELLAVDAVNNPKAYVLGIKFIKGRKKIDTLKLQDTAVPLKPATLLINE